MASLAAIVAVSTNGVIGREGDLPWRLKADLQRFKRLTMGGRLVMGRKTWQSIGRPLPGRTSFVLTRGGVELPEGVAQLSTLEDAVVLPAHGSAPVFCIGGAQIYALLLPHCDELLLTRVHAEVEGDVHFPAVDWHEWVLVESESVPADAANEFASTFERYRRRREPKSCQKG